MAGKVTNEEVCPNCGRFLDGDKLDELTGWCGNCSTPLGSLYDKLDQYLTVNADEIEHYLLLGNTFNQAIDLLHHTNGRPKCLVCGSVIRRGKRNAVFCRTTATCRKYSRRYVYLYREKGLSKTEALAQVLRDLT